jgi:hypothetical protein
MDTSNHFTLEALFDQLGLSSEPEQVKAFMHPHSLAEHQRIERAAFWSPSQAAFLCEAIADDADWAGLVDQLDVRLRMH